LVVLATTTHALLVVRVLLAINVLLVARVLLLVLDDTLRTLLVVHELLVTCASGALATLHEHVRSVLHDLDDQFLQRPHFSGQPIYHLFVHLVLGGLAHHRKQASER